MKLVFFTFFCVSFAQAQLAPFVDFSGYFRTFYKSNFRQIEFQPIVSYEAGDQLIAYIDMRGDFKLYDGEKSELITNQIVQYKLSDAQLAWNIGPTLFALSNGKKRMLTTFAGRYEVSDSLVIFEDTRFNTVNVFYKNEIIQLTQMTGELKMPQFIGDNMIAFKDFGDMYRVFWQGRTYELGIWTMNEINFKVGRDLLCFNDPTQQSFAVFENHEFHDLEPFFVNKYKAGWGFCVYEDLNGNLKHYKNGKVTELSNFGASYWEVKDDVVIWAENSFYYTFYEGEKVQLTNYKPADLEIKNGIIAFRNIMGGVSAFMNGRVHEITNQPEANYKIYGDLVLVELFNKTFVVYRNGKKYEA